MLVERPAHPLSRNPYASEDIKALQTNRLLRTLRTDEMTQLIAVGRWVVFQPGQTVTYCGTPVAEVLFLLKGRATAETSAPNGGTFSAVLNLLRPGDDVGLLSLVDDAPPLRHRYFSGHPARPVHSYDDDARAFECSRRVV